VIGALAFPLYRPHRPATYLLFPISVVLATVICFAGRYVTEAAAYWLLDARGPWVIWMLLSNLLSGLAFPMSFLPGGLAALCWAATPFPWLLQAPIDIVVERDSAAGTAGLLAGQVAWTVLMVGLAGYAQRRGTRRLVVQGG
jgi:ABC-2 type transport system permease protein